jgi:G patch domain-containing protein 1
VGSKDGWTPSAFVSSRQNRRKDDPRAINQQPEDFMDDEDLTAANEARSLQTTQIFGGFASSHHGESRSASGGLLDLLQDEANTIGLQLMNRMGWREGQGVGPKVWRKARLGLQKDIDVNERSDSHFFAPADVNVIWVDPKYNRNGLGYCDNASENARDAKHLKGSNCPSGRSRRMTTTILSNPRGGGKVGHSKVVIEAISDDEEDPYDIRPNIVPLRTVAKDSSKTKKRPGLTSSLEGRYGQHTAAFLRHRQVRCFDGRLPLRGYIFPLAIPEPQLAPNTEDGYSLPTIPDEWTPSLIQTWEGNDPHTVTRNKIGSKAIPNPKSRAMILGENPLLGGSVFEYMSSLTRDRLVAATGRTDLPPAGGLVRVNNSLSSGDGLPSHNKHEAIPMLERDIALAAISRGAGQPGPYADDRAKQGRYLMYLEHQAALTPDLLSRPSDMTASEFAAELGEFNKCAKLFRPMTGFMASRFTTSSSLQQSNVSTEPLKETDRFSQKLASLRDPGVEAAKVGLYGNLTRTKVQFRPDQLLCKRLNIKPPRNDKDQERFEDSLQPYHHGKASSGAHESTHIMPLALGNLGWGEKSSDIDANKPSRAPLSCDVTSTHSSHGCRERSTQNKFNDSKRPDRELFKAIFGDGIE